MVADLGPLNNAICTLQKKFMFVHTQLIQNPDNWRHSLSLSLFASTSCTRDAGAETRPNKTDFRL